MATNPFRNALESLLPKRENPAKTDEKQVRISSSEIEQIFGGVNLARVGSFISNLTMDRLANIFSAASVGTLYDLFEMYREIQSLDGRISGLIQTRKQASSQSPYVVTCPDMDNAQAVEAKEFVEGVLEKLNMQRVRSMLFYGRSFGVVMLEKIWAKKDGRLVIDKIELIDFSRYEMDMSQLPDSPNYGQLEIVDGAHKTPVDEINPLKLIVATTGTQKGFYDLESIMRPVARWYILKTFSIQSWAQIAETYNYPVVIVKMPEAEFKRNKGIVKRMLEAVGPNKFGLFFDTMNYEVHNQTAPSSSQMLSDFIALCNTEIAISILGQNLSSEVTGGSYAASQTHAEVMGYTLDEDISWMNEVIDDQIVDDLVKVNFPTLPYELYPRYKASRGKTVDLVKLASGISAISKLVPVSKQYIYEQSQIPEPTEGEESIGGYSNNVFNPFDTN